MKELIDKPIVESSLPHTLYIVKLSGDTGEHFCKIGITKHNVNTRFGNINEYRPYKEVTFKFKDAIIARGVESMVHQGVIFKNKLGYTPKKYFGGYTECFPIELFDDIRTLTMCIIINNGYRPEFNETLTPEEKEEERIFEEEQNQKDFELLNLQWRIEELEHNIQIDEISKNDPLILQYEDESHIYIP